MKYDESKYKIQKLPHPLLLHWILNPGLAFNECVLGQRIPKITLIDKTKDAPLVERTFVPCPSCNAMNDSRIWCAKPFGNWFGLVCPACGEKIPCLWNLTSVLILAVTFPLWIWFKIAFERSVLENQRKRLAAASIPAPAQAKDIPWKKMGLLFGSMMFLIWILQEPRDHLTPKRVLFIAGVWALGGLSFGLLMRFSMGRMIRKPK